MKLEHTQQSVLMIVSGPAGSGKTTVCDRLREEFPKLHRVVTATTRAPRPGEQDGVDYHFLSREAFAAKVANGEFFEYATVHGNAYGTLREYIYAGLAQGMDLLLNIDVQGAHSFRQTAEVDSVLKGRLCSVFIMPPSLEEIQQRMRDRGHDSEEVIQKRINTARSEMEMYSEYDYVIVSSTRDADYDRMRAVYLAEKLKVRVISAQ
jgi:guanylate kinase